MPESRPDALPPPSESYVQELEQHLLTEFGGRNARIERLRRLRFMEEPVDIPAAYRATTREVRTPLAREQLKRVVGSLTANHPTISVPPADQTSESRANASRRERWTAAALRRMKNDAERDIFGMFVDALVADGTGVMKLVYVPERWAGYPSRGDAGPETDAAFNERSTRFKRAAPFPLAWRDVDVLTFYPLIGDDGIEACLEIAERPKWLMMRRYGLVEDRRTGRLAPAGRASAAEGPAAAGGTVRVVEYWDREHFAYLVDGHLVRRGRHAYGAVPYVMAHGNQSPSRDPAKAGESMLASVEYLVPLLDRLLTMKQNAVHLYAYPTPKLTGFAGGDGALGEDGRPPPIEFRPGEILPLFPGEDLSLLQWSGTPPDLDELIALTRSMIDQAGVPTVLFGIAPGGNTSGYYLNQLINAARLSFNQITRHAEQALERIVQLAWRLVEHRVRETVYVYGDDDAAWLGLSPRDISGYYAVRAKLEALAPADEIAQGTYAANLVAAKLASRRWAMQEKLGIANAAEMQAEIMREEMLDDPEVRRALWRREGAVSAAADADRAAPADGS